MRKLFGQRTAILVADDFAIDGLIQTREALTLAGAVVDLVGPQPLVSRAPNVRRMSSHTFLCDQVLGEVNPELYQNLVLIGGAGSNMILRQDAYAVAFIAHFLKGGGGTVILEDGFLAVPDLRLLAGRTVAAPAGFRLDLIHAGANWTEEPVASDGWLVTCASLAHLHRFIQTMIDTFATQADSDLAITF